MPLPASYTSLHRAIAEATDRLLSPAQCGRLMGGMSGRRWMEYSPRWPVLDAGHRIVRVTAGGRGRHRWLRSAVIRHMREELLHPVSAPAAAERQAS